MTEYHGVNADDLVRDGESFEAQAAIDSPRVPDRVWVVLDGQGFPIHVTCHRQLANDHANEWAEVMPKEGPFRVRPFWKASAMRGQSDDR